MEPQLDPIKPQTSPASSPLSNPSFGSAPLSNSSPLSNGSPSNGASGLNSERLDPSPDDLVYKTMPKGYQGIGRFFHPETSPKPEVSAQPPQVKPEEALPSAPVPASVSSIHPADSLQQPQPPAPAGVPLTEIKPIKSVPAMETVPADFNSSLNEKPRRWWPALLIALLVILILGAAAYFASAKGYVKIPILDKLTHKQSDNGSAQLPAPVVASKIPDSWRTKYFGAAACTNANVCGDSADPDKDGLTNLQEYQNGTDPNSADSDLDKISDGDEVNIFMSDPTTAHTSGNMKYDDGQDIKTMWYSAQKRKYNDAELQEIAANIKKYGLHEPTITFLGQDLVLQYTNYVPAASNLQSNTTAPKEGALDRDTQRYNTINKIAFALLQYKETNGSYPDAQNFSDMISAIQPLIASQAINTNDPINTAPYVYQYQTVSGGSDFKLSYFSETTNQLITMNTAAANKAFSAQQAVQRDTKRQTDLQQIAQALSLYSNDHTDANGNGLYPSVATWKTELESKYITKVPVDPQTGNDYTYTVSSDSTSYGLQATLEKPPTGKRGYVCTPDNCGLY